MSLAMSKRWSCDTLKEGFNHVMTDALDDEEKKLQKEIEDQLLLYFLLSFSCSKVITNHSSFLGWHICYES